MKHLILAAVVLTAVATPARGTPEVAAPRAGFSRKMAAGTVAATLPRERAAKAVFASVRVTAELGADTE